MKALAVVVALLLVLAHPAAAAVVTAAVLGVSGAAVWLAYRGARQLHTCPCHHRRPA